MRKQGLVQPAVLRGHVHQVVDHLVFHGQERILRTEADIRIDNRYGMAAAGQARTEVGRNGGFAGTALAGRDTDGNGH